MPPLHSQVFECVDMGQSATINIGEMRSFIADIDTIRNNLAKGGEGLGPKIVAALNDTDKNHDGELTSMDIVFSMKQHPEMRSLLRSER